MEKGPDIRGGQELPTITYEPEPAETIDSVAQQMLELTGSQNRTARAVFSGIELLATPKSTVEGIVSDYYKRAAEKRKAFVDSPEGQRLAREARELKEEQQRKADALMEQLPNLDFSNHEAVLDWICEFQESGSGTSIENVKEKVLAIFAEHNYQPVVSSKPDETRDGMARHIINNSLQSLQLDGYVSQVTHTVVQKWKQKFLSNK